MDETTKMTDDAGNKKKPKLKRIVKKKPKFHLNSSINSSLYAKNVTIHKNNIMNTSVVKATLRANNKALAQSLEKVRLDLRLANDIIMMEKKEQQELQQRVATLTRVAGLRDEQIEVEANCRMKEKLQHLKSLLHQTSQHLFDGGMCIQQAMEECFSSRLSQNSDPRGSSIGFMTSDEDHSPIRSRKRAVVYRASLVNSSPPANDEAANNYLAGVQPDSTHQVDMSMILEQSVIDHSPPRSLTSFLPAVLESGNNEFHPGILDKSKRDYGLPKRVLKSDPIISTSLSSKLDGCETGFEKMNVLMDPAVNTELSPHKDMTLGETGKTFSESITVTRNDESAIPAEQNRRRETFIITSPSCQAGVENKKQENIVDRRGTFIVPKVTSESTDANSKVSTNAEPVNAASKKRNTFCVPKVCSVSNKPKDMVEDEVGRTTSETLGDDLLLSKQQSTITSQTVHMDQAVFKHPGVIGISKPAHKNKSVTKSLTTAASQSPSESKTVHDPPCVVNSDSCADDDPHVNDEHTIYFNNDMDLTEVVDVSIQSQSSSEQNNPAEKKSKPPVCLRLSKPGKITFTASRKENDGTRKIVPSKVPTIRSKSKKQLRQLQQAIAADQSQPNNIFDFHDKTPSHLQEKASVFDVSLNESATVTQPNVDVYKERLLKLTAKVHSGKDSDVMFTDSRESGSNSETKCSEDMNQNRTHISSSGGESKGKEKVKKSQTKSKVLNEALENEDQNEIDGSSSTKSSDTLSIKCMGEPSGNNSRSRSKKKKNEPLADKNTVDDIDFVSVIPEKQRRTKSRTRTKSKSVESTDDSGHGEDSSSGMKSLHKNSLVKKALSGEASNNKRTEDVSSQLKDENKEKGNKRSQMTEPVTTVGGSVKLLSDACPLYSLPLKGSPDCSLSTSKRRKSKVENSPDGNMRRTRSCSRKRVDYTEVDSETSVSPEKKCRVRSRGRSLKKKSPTNKRNRSRKQGDYSDCESTHSEKVTDENREQNTECPKNSKSGLSQVCPLETSMLLQSESDVYSLPLKASPAAKKREDGRLRNRSRSAHNLVTRRVRSQSLKRAVHSEKDNEETDNTAEPSNVVKSAPSPTAKTLSCRNSLTSRVSGVNVIGDDTSVQNNDTVNAADMQEKCKQRSPFRSVVDTGPRFSDIQAVDDLSVERSSVYRLPLKGSPDGKVKLASSRRSMSCGSVTRSSSQSRKKCQEPSQDDGPRRSRSCKRVIPLDITSDESDDSSPAPVAVRTPHSAEKSKARSRGRLKKRQSLSKMRSKSRKRLAVGSNEDVSCLETVNRDGEESTSEADGTTFKADKRSPKAYVIKKNPEKLTKKTLVTDSLDVFKLTAKQSPDRLKKHTDSFRKKKSVVDFLTMLDKSDSSIADSVTNVDSPGDKSKTENVNDTCDTKKTLKMTSVKSCKMGKQKLGLQSKTTKPQSRGEPFRWTPCVSPRNTTSPRTWKKHRESEAKKPHQEVDRKTETLKTYKERETEKSHMECEVRKSHRENENGKSHRESEVRKSVRENESRKSYKESEARKPQRESDAEKPHSKTKAEESYKESETEKSYKESKAGNAYRESEARKSHIENETKKIHTESEIKKDSVRQSSSLEILKRKLALIKNLKDEDTNSENDEVAAKRSRRAAAGVNYKMPKLNVKMRQGDPGTSSLYDGVSASVFKASPAKTGMPEKHKPMVDLTNTS